MNKLLLAILPTRIHPHLLRTMNLKQTELP